MNKMIRFVMMVMAVILMMAGCRAVKTVEVEKVRDLYHTTIDTIRDSVYVDHWKEIQTKGDTVYNTAYTYIYKDRWRTKRDTVILRDTVIQVFNQPSTADQDDGESVWTKIKEAATVAFIIFIVVTTAYYYLIKRYRK